MGERAQSVPSYLVTKLQFYNQRVTETLYSSRHWIGMRSVAFGTSHPKTAKTMFLKNIRQYKLLKLYKCWHV